MHELLGRSAAIPSPGVSFFQDDHAGALDPLIVRIDGRGDYVRKAHVGNEPAALLDLQNGFLAVLPFHDPDFPSQHPGFDADEGDGLGEREGGADLLAVLAGFEWRGQGQVMIPLLRGAALMNGRQAKVAGQAGRCRSGIHPGKLEGD